MKSNSNLQITGFTVDPTSQEITSLEVNGTPVSSSADLEDNKSATINVSTYTVPIEVVPTAGQIGMKKATITLSNIPGGSVTLYAYNENDPEGEGLVTPENMLYADASSLSSATYLISILEKEGTGSDMIKNYLNKGSVSEGLQLYRWPDYDITL